MTSSANLTRYALSLGARDTITGWCAPVYAETTIKGLIIHAGASPINLPIGIYTRYENTLLTADTLYVGDKIKDAAGNYFYVKAASEISVADQFIGFIANVVKSEGIDRPSTSGTWHVDSEAIKTDSRYRHKDYLEDYITDANLLLDDGVTQADYAVMFALPQGEPYPLLYELGTAYNDLDLLIAVNKSTANPVLDAFHYPYKLEETLTLRTFVMNKTGLTAVNLLDQAFEEISHVFSTYPIGSLRSITRTQPKHEDLGGEPLYSEEITITYVHNNDNRPVPTTPSITWGDPTSPTGTYVFPNITDLQIRDPDSGDAYMLPPSRIGEITQILGSTDFEISLTCDLDMEFPALTWKRPQTTTPKTDSVPEEVFLEIKFKGKTDADMEYQLLNLGDGATLPVRITSINKEKTGSGGTILQLTLKRYTETDGATGTYNQWYGIG